MHSAKMVRRIIVDEVREFPPSDFRECMAGCKTLRNGMHDIPIVILTATAPKQLLSRISDFFNICESDLRLFCGDCSRPNLKLNVGHLQSGSVSELVTQSVLRFRTLQGKRGLFYVRLGLESYYSVFSLFVNIFQVGFVHINMMIPRILRKPLSKTFSTWVLLYYRCACGAVSSVKTPRN